MPGASTGSSLSSAASSRIPLRRAPPWRRGIVPGSSVLVTAVRRIGGPRVLIPASALRTATDGQAQALLFEPAGADEGTVKRVDIEIVPTPDGAVQVVSGLDEGQEIVVSGAALLSDGDQVRRFTGFAR